MMKRTLGSEVYRREAAAALAELEEAYRTIRRLQRVVEELEGQNAALRAGRAAHQSGEFRVLPYETRLPEAGGWR